jgi:membrane protease YdiL (CAAX protease family)
LYICKKENINYLKLINYKKEKTKIVSVIFISILTFTVGFFGMFTAGLISYSKIPFIPIMMLQPMPIILSIISIFILPITTTLAEDGLYLGVGVNQIKNKYTAIIFSSFFYALQHSFIPFLLDTRFMVYRFISFFPLTIIFCIYYYRSRNPLPIMIGHFLINIATVFQILIISMFPELYEAMKDM